MTPMLTHPPTKTDSLLSEFDRHRLTLLSGQEGEGWQAELHRYLDDMPANVTKDTDIVKWWQVRSWLQCAWYYSFLTAYRITDPITPHSDVSQLTFLHVQHPPFLASGSSLVAARLRQDVMLS